MAVKEPWQNIRPTLSVLNRALPMSAMVWNALRGCLQGLT
jgi:hypothetical protein